MTESRTELISKLVCLLEQSEKNFSRITNDLVSTISHTNVYKNLCGGYHSPTILADKVLEICKQIEKIDNDKRISELINNWRDSYIKQFIELEAFCTFINAYGVRCVNKDVSLRDLDNDLNDYRADIAELLREIAK